MQRRKLTEQSDLAMHGCSEDKNQERIEAGQLALEVMHEIRNPLEALGHLVYLTGQEAENPEKVRKYTRMAEEQMATLNRIVSQTLGFARTAALPKASDLVELAEAAIRIHQRTIEEKKIHLVKDLPRESWQRFGWGRYFRSSPISS